MSKYPILDHQGFLHQQLCELEELVKNDEFDLNNEECREIYDIVNHEINSFDKFLNNIFENDEKRYNTAEKEALKLMERLEAIQNYNSDEFDRDDMLNMMFDKDDEDENDPMDEQWI